MRLRRFLTYLIILCVGLLAGHYLIGNTASPQIQPLAPVTADTRISIPVAAVQPVNGLLEVHFIDVGQGDSIFIRASDGSTALIDGGNPNGLALAYLRSIGVTRINSVILTHPHADHVGGLVDVLKTLPVDAVWTSGASNTTSIFEQFIDTIAARRIPYHEAATGQSIAFGSLAFDVLYGVTDNNNLNDTSLVLRLQDGNISFLFTGDAEAPTESILLKTKPDQLTATILKVGHHGSATSSSVAFLQAVHPAVAVYSAGVNNQYGHPNGGTIKRLTAVGAAIYGTDKYGTITVTTDGKTYNVLTAHGAENVTVAATALPSPTLDLTTTLSSWQLAGLPYDPMGRDRNCSAFSTHSEAQAFYIAAGGPEHDRHHLDGEHDGEACESLP
ncbi:MAG: MBL fold metallo-hydrolase [Anaerolineae bacterium]|nr:MBL fold metallo-hydrolase [Anaerolineae bacterium]